MYLEIRFDMKSTLSGASMATAALYWVMLARHISSPPLTFSLFAASSVLPLLHFSAGSIYLGPASVSHLAVSVFILNASLFTFNVIMKQLSLNLFVLGFCLSHLFLIVMPSLRLIESFILVILLYPHCQLISYTVIFYFYWMFQSL